MTPSQFGEGDRDVLFRLRPAVAISRMTGR